MLKTEALSFSYDNTNIFNFPDILLQKGEDLLILGDSGVGKTTLIQILSGLLRPQSGIVELNGTRFENLSSKSLDQFRGSHIGMVFQRSHFVRNLSILDNLLLFLYLSNKLHDKQRAIDLLEEIGLSDKMNSMPDELSQGEQQRAAIANALIKTPDLILADEPTSSLDDNNCQKIITLLKQQASLTNAKLIIITHDQRLKDQFNTSILL
ncbi:MAG: ABC transporter ATP-binding protein [Flavobacteriales bacterium TMED123]|nr:MAG: ABC transporter ATP-binding protein [Flavobacteriales bacterium TMED123]|tara:strand:- start:2405 stop:3031 length:627 start_codon:yes stop_codon:yes gene_type:complete